MFSERALFTRVIKFGLGCTAKKMIWLVLELEEESLNSEGPAPKSSADSSYEVEIRMYQ